MAKKYKKNKNNGQDPLDYVALPKIKLDKSARRSISIVIIFALGLISLLGLFNLSGKFGFWLSNNLALIFGWGKWAWPLVLLAWGWLLYKGKQHHINFFNYLGLLLLFISYQTLFHFFIKDINQRSAVLDHFGGGYVGFYLTMVFKNTLGTGGGLTVLLSLFFISIILIFNTSLHRIFGPESEWARFWSALANSFSRLFGRSQVEIDEDWTEEDGDEEAEDEDLEIISLAEAAKSGANIEARNPKSAAKLAAAPAEKAKRPALFKEKSVRDQEELNQAEAASKKDIFKTKNIKIDLPLELLNRQTGQALGGDVERNATVIKHTLE